MRVRSSRLGALFLVLLLGHSAPALADSYDDTNAPQPDELPASGDTSPPDGQEKPLGTGGLTAPGALPEKGDTRSDTERELEEADRRDAGRGLEFAWLNGEIGFQAVDAFGVGSSGLVYGGGVGLRALYFTLGARFRMGSLADFDLWSVVGEGTMRLPLGHFEPYALIGAGYSQLVGLGRSAGAGATTTNAGGFDLRVAVGADYYLSNTFSVGAQVSGDAMFLSQSTSAWPANSTGLGLSTTALVGLHF